MASSNQLPIQAPNHEELLQLHQPSKPNIQQLYDPVTSHPTLDTSTLGATYKQFCSKHQALQNFCDFVNDRKNWTQTLFDSEDPEISSFFHVQIMGMQALLKLCSIWDREMIVRRFELLNTNMWGPKIRYGYEDPLVASLSYDQIWGNRACWTCVQYGIGRLFVGCFQLCCADLWKSDEWDAMSAKASTSPSNRQQPHVFSLSRSRPAFDTSIFHPSFSNFERNFKAFAALVDLVEERARFHETLSVKIMNGSDDRYGTNKRLRKEVVDKTDDTIRYRDYDKNLQNELLERKYLRQWSCGMDRLVNLSAKWQNDVYVETVERILSDARSFGR
ncbi:MAG: hypothetical protein Q9198_003982 [Flavoplaca austrocitrina]